MTAILDSILVTNVWTFISSNMHALIIGCNLSYVAPIYSDPTDNTPTYLFSLFTFMGAIINFEMHTICIISIGLCCKNYSS